MEKNQRYVFIKSLKRSEDWIAMIADDEVLRKNGSSAESIKNAAVSTTFNAVRLREGVHFFNSSQVNRLLKNCEKMGMNKSAESLQRAIEVLNEKNGVSQNQVTSVIEPKRAM